MKGSTGFLIFAGLALMMIPGWQSLFIAKNNNPLNIRYDPKNNWTGQIGQDSRGFVVFSDPVYSVRAAFKLLNTYASKGVNTIEQIISRYAPPNENKTENYISFVASALGLPRSAKITPDMYPSLIRVMSKMESGQYLPSELILRGKDIV